MAVTYCFVTWCATAGFVRDKGKAVWSSRETPSIVLQVNVVGVPRSFTE